MSALVKLTPVLLVFWATIFIVGGWKAALALVAALALAMIAAVAMFRGAHR